MKHIRMSTYMCVLMPIILNYIIKPSEILLRLYTNIIHTYIHIHTIIQYNDIYIYIRTVEYRLFSIFSISIATYSIFEAVELPISPSSSAKRHNHRTPPSWNWVRRYIHRTGSTRGLRRPCWIAGLTPMICRTMDLPTEMTKYEGFRVILVDL